MNFDINNVKPGMVLDKPIIGLNTTMLNTGMVLTTTIIKRLKKLGIKTINISLPYNKSSYYIYNQNVETTIDKDLINKTRNALVNFDIKNILDNSKNIVSTIINSQDFKYDLSEYKKNDDIFSHSIRVASFSIILAKIYNEYLNNIIPDSNARQKYMIDLNTISTAALLHDIGKICKNDEMLKKITDIPDNLKSHFKGIMDTPLDKYDDNFYSIYSYSLLNEKQDIIPDIKLMILLSGETENEKGPLKAPISYTQNRYNFVFGAKIIHLCDMYDRALKNCIENNESLENVIAKLSQEAMTGGVNKELENLFINNVPFYSVGTKVKLSNGSYAIVKESFVGRYDTYRPIVLTKPDYKEIDLRNETTITIKEICSNDTSFQDLVDHQIYDMQKKSRGR